MTANFALQLNAAQGADRPEEFCKRYNIGQTKLFEEIKSGRLKAKKLGRATLISRTEGERWFNALPDMIDAAI
jgi:hypothetical protein